MKLYLHTCCAVCLAGLVERLRAEGSAFTAFFYNPNVHPLIEFRRRLKATQVLCERESIPLEMVKDYGLVDWLRAAAGRESVPERCEICYADRLGETARRAKAGGYDAFSTTMLASVEQDLPLIRRIAEEAARTHGVRFHDADWRGTHDAGKALAKKMSLYRQQYCGCVYSEYDRYRNTSDHVYHGVDDEGSVQGDTSRPHAGNESR